MFADSYPMREVEDGFFFEVDGSVRRRGWIFCRLQFNRFPPPPPPPRNEKNTSAGRVVFLFPSPLSFSLSLSLFTLETPSFRNPNT